MVERSSNRWGDRIVVRGGDNLSRERMTGRRGNNK